MNREHFLWHPYTSDPVLGPARKTFVRAEGAFVHDEVGRKYFDGTSSWWCQLHGHCHPRLVAALADQAARLDQILFAPHSHPVAGELAEALVAKLGSPFEKVFYSDNGSTAVEVALKMAVQYWSNQGEKKKRRFISLNRGYHGDTLGTVAVGDVGVFHSVFQGQLGESLKAPVPKTEGEIHAFERILDAHHGEIAAVVVEPLVLGAGGMIFYPAEMLERLTACCRKRGTLVIFDEVFTGFGRTGTFFALEQIESRPDFVCLSKGLTSGMLPLGATITTAEIYSAFRGGPEKTFYHGHTFTANALGCAVALESLRIFDEENVLERNRDLQALIAEEKDRFASLSGVTEVRHKGMIWAVELNQPDNRLGWRVAELALEKGLWIRPLHNILYLIPPYCTKPDELKHAFDVLYSALRNA